MKFRKIILIIILIVTIINANTECFAKYVYEYVEKAVQLEIDRTPPTLSVEYSIKDPTNSDVEVKITSSEEIQGDIEGWVLQEDKKTLIKTYEQNSEETVTVKDPSGNESSIDVNVNNIDKVGPIAEIVEIKNTNVGYEKYANKTHQIVLKVKVSDTNMITQKIEEFKILVGTKENCYNKEIKIIEESENYIIYEIKLTQITENGQLVIKVPENHYIDIAGNQNKETTLKTEIEIDNIAPTVEFKSQKLENGKVLATIIPNESIRKLNGWTSNQSNFSKEFISGISYQKEVMDFAGNASNVEVKIKDATYLGLETMAHISNVGWVVEEDNFIRARGVIGSGYNIEALMLRTNNNVDNDFLRASAYVNTYWGEGSLARSKDFGIVYNYGYNPTSGYKTLANSILATYNNKQYIHLGGEGINETGATDINGNNPIPENIGKQHRYGISGIKLDLKDTSENSIIYQIYFYDIGWQKTCKNGEQAMKATNKIIERMKIAVVPNSEVDIIINEWNKNVE